MKVGLPELMDDPSYDDLGEMFGRIQDLLETGKLVELNAFLSSIDAEACDPIVPLAALSYSFVGRQWLPSWIPLRDATKAEMEARGIDITRELVGFFQMSAVPS